MNLGTVYEAKVVLEAERILHHEFIPCDLWFSVRAWVDRKNEQLKLPESHSPGLLLAAFELLVVTGHLQARTNENGAREFRRL